MADIQFTPTFVPNRYQDSVQRVAVLRALFPMTGNRDDIIVQTQALQKLWRVRLLRLRDCGWVPGRAAAEFDVRQLQFARNCCPTFVHMVPRTSPCKHHQICPFCYARRVLHMWQTVYSAFPHLPVRREAPPRLPAGDASAPRYQLIERRVSYNLRFLDTPEFVALAADGCKPVKFQRSRFVPAAPADPYAMTCFLQKCLQWMIRDRAVWLRRLPVAGVFANVTVEPWTTCWRITHRQLFQVPPGYELPTDCGARVEDVTMRRYDCVTPQVLHQVLGRVCRYPSLLLRGDPTLTTVILHARQGQRLSATYGRFRGGQSV